MITKLSFGFTDEDMRILRDLQRRLGRSMGPVSYIAAIRWALRQAVISEKRKD